jgi:hypothetical protein
MRQNMARRNFFKRDLQSPQYYISPLDRFEATLRHPKYQKDMANLIEWEKRRPRSIEGLGKRFDLMKKWSLPDLVDPCDQRAVEKLRARFRSEKHPFGDPIQSLSWLQKDVRHILLVDELLNLEVEGPKHISLRLNLHYPDSMLVEWLKRIVRHKKRAYKVLERRIRERKLPISKWVIYDGFCPDFTDTLLRLIMGQEGCHGTTTTEVFSRVQA